MDLTKKEGLDRFIESYQICQVIRGQTMKCFTGMEKKFEENTMFYWETVQIDKDWSNMFSFFCSDNRLGDRVL